MRAKPKYHAPPVSIAAPEPPGSGEPRPFDTGTRCRVAGAPPLAGYVARRQHGVGPGMVRLVNVMGMSAHAVRDESAIVGAELLEVWRG